ncbi:MAG: hypothetical protein RL148_3251 [Planctomycetota bacterium]
MGTRTLILGGGVGGVVAANSLRQSLGEAGADHEIVVVEPRRDCYLGAAKTWVMLGHQKLEDVTRPVAALSARGITVVADTVLAIDPKAREVRTSKATLTADYLVIALGADLDPSAVPGLAQAETFYTMDGALKLGKVLAGWQGGEIVILNPRMPIKCPPAPYELAFLLDHEFKQRGVRAKTKLTVCTVEPAPMPSAGARMGEFMKDELAKRDIAYHPAKKTKAVLADRKVVQFEDGTEVRYDLLVSVLPHQAPKVVRDAGLAAAGGWIPVDPKTLQTSVERVWAIGDVTSVPLPGRYKPDVPLVLPKAAVFAEAHAKVVAEQIAAHVLGKPCTAEFTAQGFCFVEFGDSHAMGGEANFFAMPAPQVATRVPDLEQFQEKLAWASRFLATNF